MRSRKKKSRSKKAKKKKKKGKKKEKKKKKVKKRVRRKKATEILKNEDIYSLFRKIVGLEGIKLVEILLEKRIVDEFKLAELMEKEVNDVRSLLYKLYMHKLVSFSRKRDRKRGWWIYSWWVDLPRVFYLVKKEKLRRLELIEERIKKNGSVEIFECPRCELKMLYEKALENMFTCPNCGVPLKAVNLEILRDRLKREIAKIEELERKYA